MDYIEGDIYDNEPKEGYLFEYPNPNSWNNIIIFSIITVKGIIVNENKTSLLGNINASHSYPPYKYPKRADKYIIIDIKLKINGYDWEDKF